MGASRGGRLRERPPVATLDAAVDGKLHKGRALGSRVRVAELASL